MRQMNFMNISKDVSFIWLVNRSVNRNVWSLGKVSNCVPLKVMQLLFVYFLRVHKSSPATDNP